MDNAADLSAVPVRGLSNATAIADTVPPTLGTVRGDWCGIMIPSSADVTEVTAEWIKVGKWTNYRHEPVKQPGMVPVWEFKR